MVDLQWGNQPMSPGKMKISWKVQQQLPASLVGPDGCWDLNVYDLAILVRRIRTNLGGLPLGQAYPKVLGWLVVCGASETFVAFRRLDLWGHECHEAHWADHSELDLQKVINSVVCSRKKQPCKMHPCSTVSKSWVRCSLFTSLYLLTPKPLDLTETNPGCLRLEPLQEAASEADETRPRATGQDSHNLRALLPTLEQHKTWAGYALRCDFCFIKYLLQGHQWSANYS